MPVITSCCFQTPRLTGFHMHRYQKQTKLDSLCEKFMSLEAVNVWQSATLRDGLCYVCDMARIFLPVLLSLRSEPPLVSCPAGVLAKLIGLLQIRQRNCSRNISPFSLCSRSPGSLEGIEAPRTQHKSSLAFLPCIYLWFFSIILLMPKTSCMSVFC